MWDLVGNPEDRFSHNEAQIQMMSGFKMSDTSEGIYECYGFKFDGRRDLTMTNDGGFSSYFFS